MIIFGLSPFFFIQGRKNMSKKIFIISFRKKVQNLSPKINFMNWSIIFVPKKPFFVNIKFRNLSEKIEKKTFLFEEIVKKFVEGKTKTLKKRHRILYETITSLYTIWFRGNIYTKPWRHESGLEEIASILH